MTPAVDEPRNQQVVGGLSRKLLINGEWVDAASGETFESLNPATAATSSPRPCSPAPVRT